MHAAEYPDAMCIDANTYIITGLQACLSTCKFLQRAMLCLKHQAVLSSWVSTIFCLVVCEPCLAAVSCAQCLALGHRDAVACSFVQAQAAAQAGVSVIQPNIGRITDWYKRHPGYIKNQRVSLWLGISLTDVTGISESDSLCCSFSP